MTTTTKKPRYIAKSYGKFWRVYDRETASYPVSRPEFDSALPTFSNEADCQDAADRLLSESKPIG